MSLLAWFTGLDRGDVRLGSAGNIRTPEQARQVITAGVDWVILARAAFIYPDFPLRMQQDPDFEPLQLSVSREPLTKAGLSDKFLGYR